MKRKWKYDKAIVRCRMGAMLLFAALLLIASCRQPEWQHPHITDKSTGDLSGLAQPTNQVVFSSVSAIAPQQRTITPVVHATGEITYNPQLINNISVRFSGRIEKLYVRYNFQPVSKGERIMDIYSPDLVTEQQNFIFLLRNVPTDSVLFRASLQKLQLLGLTDAQIKQLQTSQKIINPLPVYSPYSGHIHDIGIGGGSTSTANSGMGNGMGGNSVPPLINQIENLPSSQSSALSVKEGMYVQSGQSVFAVYNVATVWAMLHVFQKDAALIKAGDKAALTVETNPHDTLRKTLHYVEPITGQNASTLRARITIENTGNPPLKIGALLSADITAAPISGTWIPRSAVLYIGKQEVVFLKTENYFAAHAIQTGYQNDSIVQVTEGLSAKDRIAENAQYLVDSESFIKTVNHE